MQRIARRLIAAVFALAILVTSPLTFAYYTCSATITVSASGGQSCSRTCHFYDNETGAYQGRMTMNYRC